MRTDVDILSDYTDFSRWYRVHCPYKIIPIDSIHARISPVNGVIDRPDDVFEAVGRREREREDRPVPFFRDQSGSRYQSISKLGENRSKRTSRISIQSNIFTANKQTILLIRKAADVSRLFVAAHLVYSSTVYATD